MGLDGLSGGSGSLSPFRPADPSSPLCVDCTHIGLVCADSQADGSAFARGLVRAFARDGSFGGICARRGARAVVLDGASGRYLGGDSYEPVDLGCGYGASLCDGRLVLCDVRTETFGFCGSWMDPIVDERSGLAAMVDKAVGRNWGDPREGVVVVIDPAEELVPQLLVDCSGRVEMLLYSLNVWGKQHGYSLVLSFSPSFVARHVRGPRAGEFRGVVDWTLDMSSAPGSDEVACDLRYFGGRGYGYRMVRGADGSLVGTEVIDGG